MSDAPATPPDPKARAEMMGKVNAAEAALDVAVEYLEAALAIVHSGAKDPRRAKGILSSVAHKAAKAAATLRQL